MTMERGIIWFIGKLCKAGVSAGKKLAAGVAKGATAAKSAVTKVVSRTAATAGKAFSRAGRVGARAARTAAPSTTALVVRKGSRLASHEGVALARAVATKTPAGRQLGKRLLRFGCAWVPWCSYAIWDKRWSKAKLSFDRINEVYNEAAHATDVTGVLAAFGHQADGQVDPDAAPSPMPEDSIVNIAIDSSMGEGIKTSSLVYRETAEADYHMRAAAFAQMCRMAHRLASNLQGMSVGDKDDTALQSASDRQNAAVLLTLQVLLSAMTSVNEMGIGDEDMEVARSLGALLNTDVVKIGNVGTLVQATMSTIDREPDVRVAYHEGNELLVNEALLEAVNGLGLRGLSN